MTKLTYINSISYRNKTQVSCKNVAINLNKLSYQNQKGTRDESGIVSKVNRLQLNRSEVYLGAPADRGKW